MKKHIPVLLTEVIAELKSLNLEEEIVAVDCTLGQAGHSWEIYSNIKKGVLLSIDLNKTTIEWVADEYDLDEAKEDFLSFKKVDAQKEWLLARSNFSELKNLIAKVGVEKVDFLLADLGFSNFELDQNLGISFSDSNQDLNMNYSNSGISAKDVLNNFDEKQLVQVFNNYFDANGLQQVLNKIKTARGRKSFEKISDLQNTFKNLPTHFLVKVTQALRSFVNNEEEVLKNLCLEIKSLLSENGKALIITFNPLEEKIVKENFVEFTVLDPNINEIIKNPQSRSAKLYIFKKSKDRNPQQEKRL